MVNNMFKQRSGPENISTKVSPAALVEVLETEADSQNARPLIAGILEDIIKNVMENSQGPFSLKEDLVNPKDKPNPADPAPASFPMFSSTDIRYRAPRQPAKVARYRSSKDSKHRAIVKTGSTSKTPIIIDATSCERSKPTVIDMIANHYATVGSKSTVNSRATATPSYVKSKRMKNIKAPVSPDEGTSRNPSTPLLDSLPIYSDSTTTSTKMRIELPPNPSLFSAPSEDSWRSIHRWGNSTTKNNETGEIYPRFKSMLNFKSTPNIASNRAPMAEIITKKDTRPAFIPSSKMPLGDGPYHTQSKMNSWVKNPKNGEKQEMHKREMQNREVHNREIQNREIQNREIRNREMQNREIQNGKFQ